MLLTSVGARGREADITYYYCPVIIAFPGNCDRIRSHESPHWLQSLTRGGGGGDAAAHPYLGLLHVLLWW